VSTLVCAVDGVELAESRSGALVHLDAIPKGVDPDHEVESVDYTVYALATEQRSALKTAAEDMLVHHATLHPAEGCEWAERLERAARSA
jgi:hypothetical protein